MRPYDVYVTHPRQNMYIMAHKGHAVHLSCFADFWRCMPQQMQMSDTHADAHIYICMTLLVQLHTGRHVPALPDQLITLCMYRQLSGNLRHVMNLTKQLPC